MGDSAKSKLLDMRAFAVLFLAFAVAAHAESQLDLFLPTEALAPETELAEGVVYPYPTVDHTFEGTLAHGKVIRQGYQPGQTFQEPVQQMPVHVTQQAPVTEQAPVQYQHYGIPLPPAPPATQHQYTTVGQQVQEGEVAHTYRYATE